ncbi:hypothetical protein MKZ38_010635 [Zalerion maritima]|uniref:Uncharacterized protein n=1 Tax=Zalerion maritima TaxID=339359 RepID=A0AAD5RG90_9PEZI|nr:hypothetical protein MKZ38_010635 [Zalerion maritima]
MDAELLAVLYDAVELDPTNIQTKTTLLETLAAQGHGEAAMSVAKEILQQDPLNQFARERVRTGGDASGSNSTPKAKGKSANLSPHSFSSPKVPSSSRERKQLENEFEWRLKEVYNLASSLMKHHVEALSSIDHRTANQVRDACNISARRMNNVGGSRPRAVRAVAKAIVAESSDAKAMDMIVEDLEAAHEWIQMAKETSGSPEEVDPRERLVKRRHALEAALPPKMEKTVAEAFVHVEHEVLRKTYVNDETMLGDTIPEIERSNFLATEDGYAWSMDELVPAITANGGVMRNPLSKDLFSPEDVARIVGHPLGAKLRPMQLEQKNLKKGVRTQTIQNLASLSKSLLADMTDDATESRKAVDEFLVYVAALPEYEQKVLDDLKVPGVDTHTGQSFDYTIGESVRDAKGNKTCFHKVGDFLGQASTWLGKA